MISGIKHIIFLIVLSLTIFAANKVAAQGSPYYTVNFRDTLQKDPKSQFLYNNITVKNTFNKLITLTVSIVSPTGWRLISEDNVTVDLAPGETQIIPVTIARLPNALARYMPVKITAQLKNSPLTDQYEFYVKDKVSANFGIIPLSPNIQVTNYQRDYDVKLIVRNRGNIEQHYTVILENSLFELNSKYKITIPPGRDSTVVYSFQVNKEAWNRLKKEEVRVKIINDSNKENSFSYVVDKIGSVSKQNAQPYETFPLTVEGGLMQFNNSLAYYGAVTGDIPFSKESNLGFYYRSKEYGITGPQYNVFNIFYNYKNWQIAAGQMAAPKDFYTFGNGLKLSYIQKDGMSVSIYGIRHLKGMGNYNDVAGATLGYHVNKILVKHTFEANFDTSRHQTSYLVSNDVQLVKNKNITVNVNGGAGFDHSTVPVKGLNDTVGSSFGYNLLYNKDKFRVVSTIQHNSDNFPGQFRGYQYQNHDVRIQGKSSFVGLFYRYTYSKTNYLKDSIYNLTSYNYNLSNYGVQAGANNKRMGIVVGAGVLSQTGQTTSPPKYQSFNLDYSLRIGKLLTFQTSSLVGYTTLSFSKSPDLYTQMLSLSTIYGGVQMLYSKFPNYQPALVSLPGTPTSDQSGTTETLNYGAYVNGKFLHSRLSTRLAYFVSETLTDHTYISNANVNIRYENRHQGLTMSLDGNMPLQKDNMTNHYASFSVIKDLNVPILFKRKYYDLKLTLFNDENGNGKFDANEQPLKDIQVNINNYGMLSDEKGSISYLNVEKGNYTLDFHSIHGLKGLVPADGFIQSVKVMGSTNITIPFKKSRVINGHLSVEIDTISHTSVSVLNYRVTATDSSGEKFSDLTDAKGDFTLSLPAGKYSVGLNPAAFNDETVKPSQISYNVDLITNEESIVTFKLIQKKRGVVFIKADVN